MKNYSGLTCRAFARVGGTAGSHDRAHTGSGSHAGHSLARNNVLENHDGRLTSNYKTGPIRTVSCSITSCEPAAR